MPYLEFLGEDDEKRRLDLYEKLNTTEESIKDGVRHLIHWMEMQPHLPSIRDEVLFTRFLLQFGNSVEKVKSQLETYYVMRARLVNIFNDRDPCQLKYRCCMNVCTFVAMPKLTNEGFLVAFFRAFPHKSTDVPDAETLAKLHTMLDDLVLFRIAVPCRRIIIHDLQNVSPALVHSFVSVLKYIREFMKIHRDGIEKIFVLNVSPVVTSIIHTFQTMNLVKKKILKRIVYWDKKPSDLAEVLPKECLPSDYGGDLKSLEELRDEFYQFICDQRDWFRSQEGIKADLTKMPADTNALADIPSDVLDGSFRQIILD